MVARRVGSRSRSTVVHRHASEGNGKSHRLHSDLTEDYRPYLLMDNVDELKEKDVLVLFKPGYSSRCCRCQLVQHFFHVHDHFTVGCQHQMTDELALGEENIGIVQ